MRHLVILRGIPGCGKSTLIRANGLQAFTVSLDELRLLHQGPGLTIDGRWNVDQGMTSPAASLAQRMLAQRMDRGEFIVMDETHAKVAEIESYRRLVERYRYKAWVVDLTDIPLEVALDRNAARTDHSRVPEAVIHRMHTELRQGELPDFVTEIKREAFELAFRNHPVDLSAYDRVIHIGDIQGCYSALRAYLPEVLTDKHFYVFTGDYLDRGLENAETFAYMEQLSLLPNVALLHGNHEEHLWRWGIGEKPVSQEFMGHTLPELLAAGITPERAKAFIERTLDAFHYRFGDKEVLATHGGLSTIPEHLARVPSQQMIKGVGYYSAAIDEAFSENAKADWYQVHGHRNPLELPAGSASRSFNLEGKVEFGGELRAVELDKHGFTFTETVNRKFRDPRERNFSAYDLVVDWVRETVDPAAVAAAVQTLRQDTQKVREKRFGHVSSFSFSPKVFYKGDWDAITTKARGLFIDTEDNIIVSRSYDKFFNVGERPETELETLMETLTYPVKAYVKENGFLGIVGYDHRTDALFVSSKGTPEGPYADWFREILNKNTTEGQRKFLKRFLRDMQASVTFEVIDPIRDPHIVEYGAPGLVALDVVRRAPVFQKMDMAALRRFAKQVGLPVKEEAANLPNPRALAGWYARVTDSKRFFCHDGRHIEGFVLEDAEGRMVKVKLPFYAFWKWMRSLKDRVRRSKEQGTPQSSAPQLDDPRARRFIQWVNQLEPAELEQDIITLRKQFTDTQ